MSNIAFLFLLLAFSSLPAVLPFVSPSSQVLVIICTGSQLEVYPVSANVLPQPEQLTIGQVSTVGSRSTEDTLTRQGNITCDYLYTFKNKRLGVDLSRTYHSWPRKKTPIQNSFSDSPFSTLL